jgi:hypothetical protein
MERRRSQVPAARVRKNLQVQKRSPAVPSLGDVFVMQLPTNTYLAGRVVLANGEPGRCPVPGAHLLYIYRKQLEAPKLDYSHMRPDQLVIPPVWTNSFAWTNGNFETVDTRELTLSDLLPQHCFYRTSTGKYVDELGNILSQRIEPCGEWGLVSYRWIEDHVTPRAGTASIRKDT